MVQIPSPQPKNTENFVLGIFLSKPQAWYIIAARSAVHIIKDEADRKEQERRESMGKWK